MFRGRSLRIVGPLALAAGTYSVSQTMLTPSLPTIQRDLHVSISAVTTLLSVFFVTGAVSSGIFGRLGDMYGKRRMIVIQMSIYAAGSLLGALSHSLALLICGRALMGTAIGLFPLAFSIVRDELPSERVPGAVAFISGLVAAGSVLGLAIGGVLTDHLGTSWVFWVPFGAALLSIAAVQYLLPESSETHPGRVDYPGAVLLGAAIGAPLTAITMVPTWGWGGRWTLVCFGTGVVLAGLFLAQERRSPNPLIHMPTLMLPEIRGANLATFFTGFGLFGIGAIFMQFVQAPKSTGFGYGANATQAGFFLIPGCVLMLVMSPAAGRLSHRSGAKVTLAVAGLGASVGLLGLAAAHHTTFELFFWPTILMVASGLAFSAMPLLILETVAPSRRAESTALNAIVRVTGSCLGVQMGATVAGLSAGANHIPRESGYEHAFYVQAAALAIAMLVALSLPRRAHATNEVATELA